MAKAFTIIGPKTTPAGKTKILPNSRDRHPFAQLNPNDVAETNGTIDYHDFTRTLKTIQDNARDATEPYRTNPLLHGELHTKVQLTNGQNVQIAHGLAEPAAYYWCVGAAPGSAIFSANRVANNNGLDVKKYLVLTALGTGTYDIVITPG